MCLRVFIQSTTWVHPHLKRSCKKPRADFQLGYAVSLISISEAVPNRGRISRPAGLLLQIFISFQLLSNISCLSHNASVFLPLAVAPYCFYSVHRVVVFHQCSNKSLIFQAYLGVQMTICMWKMSAPTTLQLPINIWKYKIGGCSMQFSTVSLCPVLFNLLLVKHAPMHKAELVHVFSL